MENESNDEDQTVTESEFLSPSAKTHLQEPETIFHIKKTRIIANLVKSPGTLDILKKKGMVMWKKTQKSPIYG